MQKDRGVEEGVVWVSTRLLLSLRQWGKHPAASAAAAGADDDDGENSGMLTHVFFSWMSLFLNAMSARKDTNTYGTSLICIPPSGV